MIQIEENEIVSVQDGKTIITKIDKMFYVISQSGIKSEKEILSGIKSLPATKEQMFELVSMIKEANWETINNKELINTRFVL